MTAAVLGALVVFAVGAAVVIEVWRSADAPLVTMYRSAGCNCCLRWAAHLRAAGFRVDVHHDEPLPDVRARLGVPPPLAACHTATVGRYVIEGHVPAADIQRLLTEKPEVLGIAVPGMPAGSPGMESAHAEPYEVVTFDRGGHGRVFARHGDAGSHD